ncbi:MAG: hypothetical protein ABIH63_02045 [archaeon]
MGWKISPTVTFEVGKYQRADSKTGYMYMAYPSDGLEMKRTGVRGEDIYLLFGEILNLKEKYGFKRAEFKNKDNKRVCPPLELLEQEEFNTLEKLAKVPIMEK